MKKIAFLGGGKIGRSMAAYALERELAEIAFVWAPTVQAETISGAPVVAKLDEELLRGVDLVVECASAEVVQAHAAQVLAHCDLMPFSMTALRDDALAEEIRRAAAASGHRVYLPHGAILGLDGIFDAREILTEVTVETVKHPNSLSRQDHIRTVVFEGSTREVAALYPRNVNVHAAIALAGLGFDRTKSRLVSDPGVNSNTHNIRLLGEGIDFAIRVSSASDGGVSGKYTPLSACGSLSRVLGGGGFQFV